MATSRLRLHAFNESQWRKAGSDIITGAQHRGAYMTNQYNWIKFHLDLYLSTSAVLWMDCDMLVISRGIDRIFDMNVLSKPFAATPLPQRFTHFLCKVDRAQYHRINTSLSADMRAQLCRAHANTSPAYIAGLMLVSTRRFNWTSIRWRWHQWAVLHKQGCVWTLSSQTELQLMDLVQPLELPGGMLQYLSSPKSMVHFTGISALRAVTDFQHRFQQLGVIPDSAPALVLHWNGPTKPSPCAIMGQQQHKHVVGEALWRMFLPVGFMTQKGAQAADSSRCFHCNESSTAPSDSLMCKPGAGASLA